MTWSARTDRFLNGGDQVIHSHMLRALPGEASAGAGHYRRPGLLRRTQGHTDVDIMNGSISGPVPAFNGDRVNTLADLSRAFGAQVDCHRPDEFPGLAVTGARRQIGRAHV